MKLSGNHTSLIDLSGQMLQRLDRLVPELKVSPGIITSKRSATSRNQKVKIRESISGLDVTVTDNATVQKLRIYSSSPELLIGIIQDFCSQNSIQFSRL